MRKSSPGSREIPPLCASNQGSPTQERTRCIRMLLRVLDQALFGDNDHRPTSTASPQYVTKMVTAASRAVIRSAINIFYRLQLSLCKAAVAVDITGTHEFGKIDVGSISEISGRREVSAHRRAAASSPGAAYKAFYVLCCPAVDHRSFPQVWRYFSGAGDIVDVVVSGVYRRRLPLRLRIPKCTKFFLSTPMQSSGRG